MGLGRDTLPDLRTRCFRNPLCESRILQHPTQPLVESLGIMPGSQDTRAAVRDDLGWAAGTCCHERPPHGHALRDDASDQLGQA